MVDWICLIERPAGFFIFTTIPMIQPVWGMTASGPFARMPAGSCGSGRCKGFTGWTTAESLSREKSAVSPPDAPVRYDNYQEVVTADKVTLYDAPGGSVVVRELAPGTPGPLSPARTSCQAAKDSVWR